MAVDGTSHGSWETVTHIYYSLTVQEASGPWPSGSGPNCRMQRTVWDKVPFEATAAGR